MNGRLSAIPTRPRPRAPVRGVMLPAFLAPSHVVAEDEQGGRLNKRPLEPHRQHAHIELCSPPVYLSSAQARCLCAGSID
jgi:hypothetical protein